nr:putative protein N(5)-glutamine methyltransferase [Nocardioides sp. zg-DK7169]
MVERLRAAGCVYAEEEAAVLREAAAGDDAALERMLAERLAGRPLETVVGWTEFDGVHVALDPGVFVPRRRTSYVARLGAAGLPTGALVVDLCCGSGALGAAIARRVPAAVVHAADLDPVAVACARRNLPAQRVHHGDLYAALPDALRGRVDLLAVNAPYVPSDQIGLMPPEARLHEPRTALDGGPDGLDLHRRVAGGAPAWLAPGGRVLLETSTAQAPRTAALLTAAGLTTQVRTDDALGAVVAEGRLPD